MLELCQIGPDCDQPADGVVDHPVRIEIRCCQRCANRGDLDLRPETVVPPC